MFRRGKGEDEDPFAALKEANERGSTRVTTGHAPTSSGPTASGGGGGSSGGDGSGGSGGDGNVAFGAPAGIPGGAPKRRRNAPLALLMVLLSLGGAGALVYFSESPADEGAYFTGPQRNGDGEFDPGRTTTGEKPRKETPPKRVDLVQPTGFGTALSKIERMLRGGERVWLLRVDRSRVTALTRLRNGDQRSISVTSELETNVSDAGSAGSHRGMPLQRISAFAPSQATRNAARKADVSTRKLDYLVMSTPIIPGDQADWQLFFRDVPARDSHFSASLDGRTVQRPGEPSTTSTLRITTNGSTRTITGAQAQRITDCIRRAGTDSARIQRCLP